MEPEGRRVDFLIEPDRNGPDIVRISLPGKVCSKRSSLIQASNSISFLLEGAKQRLELQDVIHRIEVSFYDIRIERVYGLMSA